MDAASLTWLQATLVANTAKPTLIFLHHPPFVSGIGYLDDYRYTNHGPLEAIIAGSDNVQPGLCGHVHRPMAWSAMSATLGNTLGLMRFFNFDRGLIDVSGTASTTQQTGPAT
jgi:3',5'-cyclic AMP phosphodiesterase CpdA